MLKFLDKGQDYGWRWWCMPLFPELGVAGRGQLGLQSAPKLHRETLSQKKKKQKQTNKNDQDIERLLQNSYYYQKV